MPSSLKIEQRKRKEGKRKVRAPQKKCDKTVHTCLPSQTNRMVPFSTDSSDKVFSLSVKQRQHSCHCYVSVDRASEENDGLSTR